MIPANFFVLSQDSFLDAKINYLHLELLILTIEVAYPTQNKCTPMDSQSNFWFFLFILLLFFVSLFFFLIILKNIPKSQAAVGAVADSEEIVLDLLKRLPARRRVLGIEGGG